MFSSGFTLCLDCLKGIIKPSEFGLRVDNQFIRLRNFFGQ
jgi:hypothetical protein